jgi:WD40 repeat protein
VNGLAFSPNGRILATAGQDGSVGLWDTQTFRKIKDLVDRRGAAGAVNGIAFSPDNPTIVTATAGKQAGVTFWNLDNYTAFPVPVDTGPVHAIAFSPDGRRLATGSNNGSVQIWDTTSRRPIVTETEHTDEVLAVAFSPDGRTLATGSADASVRLWDTGSEQSSLRHLTSLTGPTESVWGVAFSPDRHTLASAGADATVGLWNVSGPSDDGLPEVWNAAVSGPHDTLVTAGRNHKPLLWKTAPDSFLPTFQRELAGAPAPGRGPGAPFGMAISPDGGLLAAPVTDSSTAFSSTALWDLQATPPAMTLVPGGADRQVQAVAFRPDGAVASAISDSKSNIDIELRNTKTLQLVGELTSVSSGSINEMAFSPNPGSPDAMIVAIGREDGSIAVSVREDPSQTTWSPPQILPGDPGFPVEAVAFSPDGAMLAGGSDHGSVKLWNLKSKPVQLQTSPVQLQTSSDPAPPILSIAFSPAGKTLAAASRDGTIKLWEVGTGQLAATFTGPAGTTSVTFPPDGDGSTLTTSDQNGTPVVWALNPDQVRERLCSEPQPTLTRGEWSVQVPTEPYRHVCR